uniref:Vitellogenin 1 n=1 Tax=Neoseiulus cucumeris TaxID=193551 RepID=S5G8C9_9ACAR|nr:vitellogenin 1 [Neoseiulus cucumeris]
MRFFLPLVLLAAAVSGEVFHFVGQRGQSTVYGVRGAVTVGVQKLTGEKTALEYNGTLALEQVREGEYLAKFTQFTLGKYDKINRDINDETFGDLKPEEQRLVKALREQGQYEHEMQRPVKFYMKEGKVVRVEAAKEHQQWSLNIFRGVFTLFQNQVHKPSTLAVPSLEYKYEDGITGNCKVQYEILSQPDEHHSHNGEVYNMTKTVDYKDCLGRPVYHHLKDVHRGCAGVCDNHKPDNFLGKYEEEQTDYELKPTPGCLVNQQFHDSLITVNGITKYNVSGGLLEEARTESTDLYRLFGGEIEVFTRLQLRLRNTQGPKIEEPQNVQTYTTLQHRLPVQEENELDIPIYALMKEHSKHQQYPQYFKEHFEAVIRELHQIEQQQHQQGQENGHEKQTFDTPAYMIELIQAVSGMTEEELKKTIPEVVRRQQPKTLSEEDQLRRQLWIELVGKAGSKTAVKLAVEFIKNKTFTPSEVRRVLQDIAGFQSYPDTDMIEQVLALCTQQEGLTSTGKATACVAAGKIISKGCDSKVFRSGQKEQEKKRSAGRSEQSELGPETEEYEVTMGHLVIKSQLRCTPQKLQQYIERLAQALRQSTNFKQVVAYINGLSKIQKPEVLPTLIGYVNGTAPNMHQLREQGEQQDESVDFVRRVAIVSLRDIATKYPKEINPIVRIIYQNTTEKVQTRLVAFDVWMNTEPAQWEVEKVLWVANKDTSVELTHYVYTALRTAMLAEEPCYQLLAQRIRAVWTQIRPFDSHMKHSQFRSKSIYDWAENFGVRGIWKIITSNTTILPAFTQTKLEQIRGPYLKTLFSAKLLVKGGDKIWDELTGKDGLLERIAHAISGQIRTGERQHQSEQLLEDIAEGLDVKKFDNETPKAVLFWRLFSGEAVIPIDAEYVKELKQELLQTVSRVGKEGVSGHYMRVLVPTKAFHVEPTSTGLPIVHSTIHPIVISVRYENVKLHYKNQQGRVLPESFELTGSFKPTVLSYRQSRVFVADKAGQTAPTLKVSGIKEFTLGFLFKISFEHGQRRFQINIKPQFERVFHSGHCTELKLEKNTILDEKPRTKVVDYGKCVKSLHQPIRREQQLGSSKAGMMLRLTGESHQPWSGLPLFGSKDAARNGVLGALLNRLANEGMKHHSISLYLETDKQNPMNEWSATIDMDSNLDALAKIPIDQQTKQSHKIKAHYQPRRQEQLNSELQQVLGKVDSLLEKSSDKIQGTTIEKQVLIKLEGRYQGQPRNTVKIAMKKVYNLEKTEQQFAFAAETQQSRKAIEIFGEVSYPKISSPFSYDPSFNGKDQRMNGTLIAKLQGQQEETYRVNFQAVKSEEQRQETELKWFEARCLAEQQAAKDMTDACKKAILKDNSLDSMEMTIQLPNNVHPKMKQLAKQALAAVKFQFYPNMQSEISGRQQQEQQHLNQRQEIHISANATRESQWSLLYNVRFEMPRENVTLSNIRLPGLRPVHMQLTQQQQLEHVAARGEYRDVCVLGKTGVRTYDNVTFGLNVTTHCEYILTRDQTPGGPPGFTVTFKVVNEDTAAKEVRVQLLNTFIELKPFHNGQREFTVGINGTEHKLTFKKPIVTYYGGNKRFYITAINGANVHEAPTVDISTDVQEIRLQYNGHAVKTIIDPRYKGHVRGICGTDDNEQTHEFIGPNGKEFKHANEFIASYGLGKKCQSPAENTHEKMMEKLNQELKQIRQQEQRKSESRREQMFQDSDFQGQPREWQEEMKEFHHGSQQGSWEEDREDWSQQPWTSQENHQTLKTAVSIEKDDICFSVEPVPTCQQGYRKDGILRTERVQSICQKKHSDAANKAMQDIRRGIIIDVSQLEQGHTGRLVTLVNIPKCVRRD